MRGIDAVARVFGWRLRAAPLLLLVATWPFARAFAQEAGPDADAASDAGPQADASAPAPPTAAPDPRTEQVRALIAGTLDVSVDPQSLFDVPLDQEDAVQVDAVRLDAVIHAAEQPPPAAPVARLRQKRAAAPPADAGPLPAEIAKLSASRWQARLDLDLDLDLDRARLRCWRGK